MPFCNTASNSRYATHFNTSSLQGMSVSNVSFIFFNVLKRGHQRKERAAVNSMQSLLRVWEESAITVNQRQSWENTTRKRITKRYYWPNISKDMNQYIASCHSHQCSKYMSLKKAKSKLLPINGPKMLWCHIVRDLLR